MLPEQGIGPLPLAGIMRDCARHSDINMFNKIKYLVIALLVGVLSACGQDAEPVAEPAPDMMSAEAPGSLDQGLSLINSDAIEAHLRFLADDARKGRMTGTPEYDEAAAYVAKHFAEIGLEAGGEDGSWFQAVPMLARRIDVDSATVVFHQAGVE